MNIYTWRDDSERTELEKRTYARLSELGIEYTRVDHDAAATIADCLEIDEALGATMCKNLFLCNSQKTVFYLLMMPGEKHFKTKEVSRALCIARLSFAPEEFLYELTEIRPGAVSVLGLMNDKEKRVKLLIDKEILEAEYIGCHPCVNTSSLKIKTEDIIGKFLPAIGHGYTVIELSGE